MQLATQTSTLVELLRSRAQTHPDRTAYVFLLDGETEAARRTYGELDARARAIAALLQREGKGGEVGERAVLLFPPGLEFIEAFFGCLYAGVIAVPSYPPRPGREQPRLQAIVEDARPRFALTTAGIAAKVPTFAATAPAFGEIRWLVTEELPPGLDEEWRAPDLSGESLAFLQYTSGSTATPKGVEVSHGNLLFMEGLIQRAFEQDADSVVVGWLPVYHDMGLIGNVLQPLYLGSTCILISPVSFLRRPRRWLEAISRYRATTSGGPNFAYELCVERIPEADRQGLDLSSWRVAFDGAEPVRAAAIERFAEAFGPYGFRREAFLPCYGLAEATLLVSGTVAPHGPVIVEVEAAALESGEVVEAEEGRRSRALVSCGRVPDGQRVEVVNPVTLLPVAPGRVGELWVEAGPGIPRGYWERPETSREVFEARTAAGDGPYLRTGDLGFLRDGELFVTGRLKDLVILRGRNHYPQDLELTAERSAPGLASAGAAAFSVDVDGEERLVLAQETLPRVRPSDEQVREMAAAIRRAVAEEHEVQVWDVVVLRPGALPKTSSGKVQRQLCRRMYLDGELESFGHSRLAEARTQEESNETFDREAVLALAPEDRAEALAEWLRGEAAAVLRVPRADLAQDRPLLELGLDSLAAIELGQAVEAALSVELPVADLLEGVGIGALAEGLAEAIAESSGFDLRRGFAEGSLPPGREEGWVRGEDRRGVGAVREDGPSSMTEPPPLLSSPHGQPPPSRGGGTLRSTGGEASTSATLTGGEGLSHGQRGLWFLHRLSPSSTAYHLTAAARLHGEISASALRAAFQALVDRHEALRTTFLAGPGGEPVPVVHPSLEVCFTEHDAAGWSDEELHRRLEEEAFLPFDLERGPLLRISLFTRGPGDRILLGAVHHIAADFWSFGLMMRDLAAALGGAAPAPAPRYGGFVRWQSAMLAGESGERLWRYWHDRLEGLPPLDLPLDRPRPVGQVDASTDRAGCRRLTLDPGAADRFKAVARDHGSTLYAALLTAFQVLLHRLSGQADLAVGSPVAGRPAGFSGAAETVGYFINPVVLRSEMHGDPRFDELLAQTRSRVLQALAHGDLPLPLLVQRLRPEHRDGHLVQAVFLLHRPPADLPDLAGFALGEEGGRLRLGEVELESLPLDPRAAQFDLSLSAGERHGGLGLSLVYDADLFDGTTAGRWLGHFAQLLAGIADHPAAPVSALPLLGEAERHQLLAEWNDRAAPSEPLLPRLFEARAALEPGRTAVWFEGLGVTYGELNARADRLARHLLRLGIEPETPVGVYLDRGPDLVAALLAVMKAGGAYVPLDPSYPAERLLYMLGDAGARLVVTRRERFDLEGDRTPVFLEDEMDVQPGIPLPRIEPNQLAYVLYTSGSTGRPKGVQISHGSLANLLRSMRERPGLGRSDRLLAVTPVSFDISGLELFLPLTAGAELVLVDRETAVDGARLLAAVAETGATVLQATPATWRLLLAAGWKRGLAEAEPLRAWCGGEALPPELAAALAERSPEVWNLYGPTETTIWSAVERVDGTGPVLLGFPVAETQLHVLDRHLRSVPPGVAGELCIGGGGVARGYRGRSDLTAERFVPDPFASEQGARFYRTGDLARRRATGALEFLGRLDHQVKVRGFRIELGEIEAVLARHLAVAQAVVLARDEGVGETRLAAWLVAARAAEPAPAELRDFLRERLPEYMIPASFARLEKMPLTPAGKVDRKALARLVPAGTITGAPFEAPRGALEETLAEIWSAVLRLDPSHHHRGRVGRQDDFFDHGGHSLLATQVVSRMRSLLGVTVPLRALFEAPTLATFAERVRREMRREGGTGPAVLPLVGDPELRWRPAPLSFAQQRVWFLEQLERGTAAYNIPVALRLEGPLDAAAFEAAFSEVVRRHDALRTTFHSEGDEPLQVVTPPGDLEMPIVDLSGLGGGALSRANARGRDGEGSWRPEAPSPALPRFAGEGAPSQGLAWDEARRLLEEDSRRPFDLERGPLFRPLLLRLAPGEHALSATIHHIVSDGWSAGVMVRELVAFYGAALEGRPSNLPELPLQYADFARWQRRWLAAEEGLGTELAFWREELRGLPPRLDLPTDRPRTAIQSPRGVRLEVRIGEAVSCGLRALARAEGATPFMALMAGFQALLSRLSGQDDLAVGSPVAGRTRTELEGLIGFFVNTLVIRGELGDGPGFRSLLGRVRERTLAAQAHQELPFEKLVEELAPERSLGHTPLFQVMLVFQNTPPEALALPGLAVTPLPVDTGTAKLDLLLSLEESGPESPLTGWLELNADLFDVATVRRLFGQYETLLAAALADPERRASDLPLLTPWELHQVLLEVNDPAEVPVPWGTLHEAFARQAERSPDAPALVWNEERISYRDLDRRSNRLARYLAALGAAPEEVVGVCLPRTADLVIALLAILKTGAAYLPLDPAYPAERIAFMLADAQSLLLVTREVLDRDRDAVAAQSPEPLPLLGGPGHLAYVIYTSGSTGRPKGVAIEHASAAGLVAWAGELHGPEERARVLAATSVSFDLSVFELFLPLAFGGAVVLAEDALALPTLPAAGEVTLVNTVPSALAGLLEMGPLPASVRAVNLAGEPLRRALVGRIHAGSSAVRVLNLYGPSEDTTYSTFASAAEDGESEPTIGRPVAATQAHVVDRELRPQPLGIPGELCLGGGGLARGYLGRPDLTAERFVPDPFGESRGTSGGRLYRTGDLVRRRTDGELEFLGRIDHQVKIRGFRIELGEIESALAHHPEVQEVVVLARDGEGPEEGRRLVAYVVQREAQEAPDRQDAAELVSAWSEIYDDIYRRSSRKADPLFDIECWHSSYTGEPIPAEEMREWVDRTVERVLSLERRRVLEVGCGTGLLLYRVAPQVERYRGTDVSEVALAGIRRQIETRGLDATSQIALERAAADDWSGVAPGDFDLVVLNSVAQYFPSAEYLARSVEGAVRAVGPEGTVFLGDLRSLPLLEAFHTSVELHHAPETLPSDELRERVHRRMAAEEELAVDPAFFHALARHLPEVRRVEVLLKRGRHHNELTRFRYDVVLHVGAGETSVPMNTAPIDWQERSLSIAALEELLTAGPGTLTLTNVPNARLVPEAGIDPEDVWELAERLGYKAELSWGQDPSTFTATFRLPHRRTLTPWPPLPPALPPPGRGGKRTKLEELGGGAPLPGDGSAGGRGDGGEGLSRYTNDPLRSRTARQAQARFVPELRRALEAELPEHMIPSAFAVLDALPLTPNGKIDRLALSRIAPSSSGAVLRSASTLASSTPQGPIEELLAGIWSELLWIESVGRDDHFFELGGHSLLATRVVSRVREALGVELPLTALFEEPTLAGLARRIESVRPVLATGPIPRVPRDRPLPLSFAQRRLWFLDRLAPGQAAYNMPLEMRLRGRLDVAALSRALDETLRRQEGLRAVFLLEGEEPAQTFAPPGPVPLPVLDLMGLPAAVLAREARRVSGGEARRPFDLARGPLLRAMLLRLGEGEHRLLLTLHHIVSDGWSLEVLFRDLAVLYGGGELPELAVQPADHAVWEQGFLADERLVPQLAYWERQLAGVPVLELPADRPRLAVQTLRGASRELALSPELSRAAAGFARQERATLFTVLLAAFEAVLFRYAGQGDLAVGSPVANRGRAELEPLIGLFVNTLVLRTRFAGDLPFRELLERVRRTVLEAFRHSDLPFERLVEHLRPERSLSHNPLFQTTFALQQVPRGGFELPGLALEPVAGETGAVKFDLTLSLLDRGESGGGLVATLEFATDLFDGATAERMLRHFANFLAGAIAVPEEPLARLPLLGEEERAQILCEWSDGGPATAGAPVHVQVAARAARFPESPAVVSEAGVLTYGDLQRSAERLAGYLRSLGVEQEQVVGLYAARSPELVVGMLGILLAGAAYAPLDPAWPRERVAFAVEDAAMPVLLTQARLAEGLKVGGARVVRLDADRQEIEASPPFAQNADLHGLAYVIYTSGSTGTPKGVAVGHDGLVNLVDWHRRTFGVTSADRTTHVAGVAFDASVIEIWPCLAAGASLHLIEEDARLSPPRLVRWLAEERITVGWLPTPLAELVLDEPWPEMPLRVVLTGGDRLRRRPPAGLPFTLINQYGPTESTVVTTSGAVEPEGEVRQLPSIGRPVQGLRVYLLDRDLQPVPAGVPGELYAAGVGIARGYLGRPDLTAAAFLPDPFGVAGGRLYRTGDLARWLADGEIEFLRRLDDQVKVKGFRIELGEIEAALAAHPAVRDAVVVARTDPRGETRLVAYGVAAGEQEPPAGELRAFLRGRLPEYMVPAAFVFLAVLPLTPNGKVDRAALPSPDWRRPEIEGDFVAPRTPVEELLAAVWMELLGLDRVGIHDNFFELGGHSLKAGQLVLRVRDTFGLELPVRAVFEAPTVAAMAVTIGIKLVEQADPELLAQVMSEMEGA